MLKYKTETRPGLVALYDIRPGNGAGPFLQPRTTGHNMQVQRDLWSTFLGLVLLWTSHVLVVLFNEQRGQHEQLLHAQHVAATLRLSFCNLHTVLQVITSVIIVTKIKTRTRIIGRELELEL